MADEGGETAVLRRIRPGTKTEDFRNWEDQPFEEMDSTLAVQQHIQQCIARDISNVDGILTAPDGQDEGVWKYEHLRQFCLELNGIAVKLQGECNPDTCTQMTATEQWIFLCAAHKTPKECSAIDYTRRTLDGAACLLNSNKYFSRCVSIVESSVAKLARSAGGYSHMPTFSSQVHNNPRCPAIDYTRHTLDGAACLLNSNKYFPSRVSIKESSVAKLGSVCRRIYRIFSHAYFHHRALFDQHENETHLCKRFTTFVTKYKLMAKDNLIVPILEETPAPDESEA